MKKLWLPLGALLLACAVTSCDRATLWKATNGLERAIASLPESNDFAITATMSGESQMKECYYAQASIAVGTPLSEDCVLEAYSRELQSQVWELEQDRHETQWILSRGTHEIISVRVGAPGWKMELDEGFQQARDTYPTFVFLTLTYILPAREGCW